jgi:hypothetical protein
MKKLESFKVFQKTEKKEIIVNKVLIGYSRISSKMQESNYSIQDQEKLRTPFVTVGMGNQRNPPENCRP